jgi:hypothetical protein
MAISVVLLNPMEHAPTNYYICSENPLTTATADLSPLPRRRYKRHSVFGDAAFASGWKFNRSGGPYD